MKTPLTQAEYEFLDAYLVEDNKLVRGPCTETLTRLGIFEHGAAHSNIINLLTAIQVEWRSDPNWDGWAWMQREPGAAPPCPWATFEKLQERDQEVMVLLKKTQA